MEVIGHFREPSTGARVHVLANKGDKPEDVKKRYAEQYGIKESAIIDGVPEKKKKKTESAVTESDIPPPKHEDYEKRSESATFMKGTSPLKAERQPDVMKASESREKLLNLPAAFQFAPDKPLPSLREKKGF